MMWCDDFYLSWFCFSCNTTCTCVFRFTSLMLLHPFNSPAQRERVHSMKLYEFFSKNTNSNTFNEIWSSLSYDLCNKYYHYNFTCLHCISEVHSTLLTFSLLFGFYVVFYGKKVRKFCYEGATWKKKSRQTERELPWRRFSYKKLFVCV